MSILANATAMQRSAFELGFRYCERGMNLQEALAHFDRIMALPLDEVKRELKEAEAKG